MKSILLALALTLSTAASAQSVLLSCRSADGSNVRQTVTSLTMEAVNPKGNEAMQNRIGNLFDELRNSSTARISSIKLEVTGKNPVVGVLTVEAVDSAGVEGKIFKFQKNVALSDLSFSTGTLADKMVAHLKTTAVILYEMTPISLDVAFSRTECFNPF